MIFYITGPDHSGKSTLANEIIEMRKANYIHCTYSTEWELKKYHEDMGKIARTLNNYGQDVILDRWCLDAYPYRFVNKENTYDPRDLWNEFLYHVGNDLILIYCLPANEFDPNKREEMFSSKEVSVVEKEFNKLFSKVQHYTYFYKTDGNDMQGFINRCIKLQSLDPLDYTWKSEYEEAVEEVFSKHNIPVEHEPVTLTRKGKHMADNIKSPEIKIIDEKTFDYSKLPKVVAVDFDGTLSLNAKFPACGDLNIDLANELYNGTYKDYKKILYTNRTGQALEDAVRWCNDQGIVFDAINDNIKEVKDAGLNPKKPWFDILIDDKVINVDDIKSKRK